MRSKEFDVVHDRGNQHTIVRPDMRYCFRSGRFHPNPRTKHISVPPRHMTKSYISDFNMISQHYRYKDTHLIQSAYNCLNIIHQRKIHVWVLTTIKCLMAKVKHTNPTSTRVQALRRGPLASHRRVFAKASKRMIMKLNWCPRSLA